MKQNLALIPCEDRVELCSFSGKFDEGEGMSMGQVIVWKNPEGATRIKTVGDINQYRERVAEWLKTLFKQNQEVDEIYVNGLEGDYEGYWTREDVGACGITKYRCSHCGNIYQTISDRDLPEGSVDEKDGSVGDCCIDSPTYYDSGYGE